MRKLLIAIALLFLLPLIPAQAGIFFKEDWEKEDCPKKHSLAWCLADFQGRSKGVFDDKKQEFWTKLIKAGITDESKIADIMHSGLGAGIAVSEFAVGSLFGGSMFLLSALIPHQADMNKIHSYMVFFDEGDPGRTEKQVLEELSVILEKAITNSLPVLPKEAKVTALPNGYKIVMPGSTCTEQFDCTVAYPKANPKQTRWFQVEKKENIPAYLGASTAFTPLTGATVGIGFYKLPKEINSVALAKAISERLPPWIYWYIPTGYFGGNPFPMFLNQGNAMFFVKPGPDSPVPEMPHVTYRSKRIEKPVEIATPAQVDDVPLDGNDARLSGQAEQRQHINAELLEASDKQNSQLTKAHENSLTPTMNGENSTSNSETTNNNAAPSPAAN